MPKLPKKLAKEVEDTEGGAFALLDNGRYLAKLRDVSVKQKEGSEFPYWSWEFDNLRSVDGEETFSGRQWANTSMSPKAFFKLKEMFEAFGVSADTDTDELIGEDVILVVGTRTIPEGERKGEQSNTVNNVLPANQAESGDDGGDDEDEF